MASVIPVASARGFRARRRRFREGLLDSYNAPDTFSDPNGNVASMECSVAPSSLRLQ